MSCGPQVNADSGSVTVLSLQSPRAQQGHCHLPGACAVSGAQWTNQAPTWLRGGGRNSGKMAPACRPRPNAPPLRGRGDCPAAPGLGPRTSVCTPRAFHVPLSPRPSAGARGEYLRGTESVRPFGARPTRGARSPLVFTARSWRAPLPSRHARAGGPSAAGWPPASPPPPRTDVGPVGVSAYRAARGLLSVSVVVGALFGCTAGGSPGGGALTWLSLSCAHGTRQARCVPPPPWDCSVSLLFLNAAGGEPSYKRLWAAACAFGAGRRKASGNLSRMCTADVSPSEVRDVCASTGFTLAGC